MAAGLRLATRFASLLPFVLCGCHEYTPENRFLCGTLVPGTDSVRRCAAPNEVCVCARNSCARRVEPSAACASGLIYRGVPFAEKAVQYQCADAFEAATALPLGSFSPCPGLEPPDLGSLLLPDLSAAASPSDAAGPPDAAPPPLDSTLADGRGDALDGSMGEGG